MNGSCWMNHAIQESFAQQFGFGRPIIKVLHSFDKYI